MNKEQFEKRLSTIIGLEDSILENSINTPLPERGYFWFKDHNLLTDLVLVYNGNISQALQSISYLEPHVNNKPVSPQAPEMVETEVLHASYVEAPTRTLALSKPPQTNLSSPLYSLAMDTAFQPDVTVSQHIHSSEVTAQHSIDYLKEKYEIELENDYELSILALKNTGCGIDEIAYLNNVEPKEINRDLDLITKRQRSRYNFEKYSRQYFRKELGYYGLAGLFNVLFEKPSPFLKQLLQQRLRLLQSEKFLPRILNAEDIKKYLAKRYPTNDDLYTDLILEQMYSDLAEAKYKNYQENQENNE